MTYTVEDHKAFVKRCAASFANDPSYCSGMRSGISDAAHFVDILRSEIEKTGRASKAKTSTVSLLQEIGDSIWAMRELIPNTLPAPTATNETEVSTSISNSAAIERAE